MENIGYSLGVVRGRDYFEKNLCHAFLLVCLHSLE